MAFNSDHFLSKTLGKDFFESLAKVELWKPGTRTVIDHEEIKTALMIVPRTLMALLIRELTPMTLGETKEIKFDFGTGAMVRLTKHERDVYSGEVFEDNKMIVDIKYRSIPGIGLVIMSAFEMYDTEKLIDNDKQQPSEDVTQKVQQMIDERMDLHTLVNKVVDKKLEERDAIKALLLAKINEDLKAKKDIAELAHISKISAPMEDDYFRGMANGMAVADSVVNKKEPDFVEPKKKESPLKGFLDQRKNKQKPAEFSVQMSKGEQVECPDCKKNIFDGKVFSGCVCLGDDMDRKIHIKKTEDGVKIRFGRGWDVENIEMLLEVLRSKRG